MVITSLSEPSTVPVEMGMTLKEVIEKGGRQGSGSLATSIGTYSETVPVGKIWYLLAYGGLNSTRQDFFFLQVTHFNIDAIRSRTPLVEAGGLQYETANMWLDQKTVIKIRDGYFVAGDSCTKYMFIIEFDRSLLLS